jgi:hypothetical protein
MEYLQEVLDTLPLVDGGIANIKAIPFPDSLVFVDAAATLAHYAGLSDQLIFREDHPGAKPIRQSLVDTLTFTGDLSRTYFEQLYDNLSFGQTLSASVSR